MRLPPGPKLERPELISEHQRWRILGAAALTLLEEGYAQTTVAKVTRSAGVSSRTFYQQFDNLSECLHAAHQMAARVVLEMIEAACRGPGEALAAERIEAAIRAGFELVAAEPSVAYLIANEVPVGLPAARTERVKLIARLAAMLAAIEPHSKEDSSPVSQSYLMIAGALSLVAECIREEAVDELSTLAPQLVDLLMPPRAQR